MEDRLIPADGRPILASGTLFDVSRMANKYRLHFRKPLMARGLESVRLGSVDVDFILTCSMLEDRRTEAQTLADQLTSRIVQTLRDDYIFVAKVQTVSRRNRLVAKASEEDNAEVQEDDSPHFVATGECLAVKYLGE